MLFDDGVDQCRASVSVVHVQVGTSAAREGRQGLADLGRTIVAGGSANDHKTLLGQMQGNRCANATGRPCDQCNLFLCFAHAKIPFTSARVAGSYSATPFNSASMRLVMPASTLPGPHSTRVVTPRAFMACTHSTQRTGPKA